MTVQNSEATHTVVGRSARTERRGGRLRGVAYRAIKNAILDGLLKPELPLVEERLAAELGISRTPIREALAILEHEGLIESVPYQGLFIKDMTVTEFLEMYETHELIEPELARRAALNATARDIADMEAMLARAEGAIPDDIPGHFAACRLFIQRLGECSNQQYMSSLLMSIEERSDLYLIGKWRTLPADKMLAAVSDRRAILKAIRLRDPDSAAQASRQHAQAVRVRWRELYKDEWDAS